MQSTIVLVTLLGSAIATTFAPPKGQGVLVSIENGPKGLKLGSEDRARFDLNEQYFPLSRAGKAVGDLDALRIRLAGVKNVARDRAPNAIDELEDDSASTPKTEITADDAAEFPTPLRLMDGEWQAWTNWSGCIHGHRTRIRACVARRPAWRVSCPGDAKETSACFDTVKKTPVANDPWTIEKEITRTDKQ